MTAATGAYGVKLKRSAPLRLPMHSEAPDHGSFRDWIRKSDQPIAVDLFCGAGGLSLGLEEAGYRIVLGVDTDPWSLETHAHNFEGLALNLDLAKPDARDDVVQLLGGIDVDLIAGGPPCQPYSRAGRSKIRSLVKDGARDPLDHRRELWRSFLDIVERVRPLAVLMENVPDMALSDDTVVLRHMIARLEAAGYETDARLVDTWLYGVPQHRQRLVLVAIRDASEFNWPDRSDRVTLRDAICDLPVLAPERDDLGASELPYSKPISDFQRRARKRCTGDRTATVHDHVTRAVRHDDLELFSLMQPGTLYSDLPDHLRRYRADIFDDKYNRLAWNDLSRSITAHIAKDGYWYIHPDQNRTLTVREAARIQTFPDDFRFAGSRSHQFAQIGNAVPPAVGEMIAAAILRGVRSGRVRSGRTGRQWYSELRQKLLEWAERDREHTPWAYAGEAWRALVGQIVGARGDGAWPGPKEVLELVPTWQDATPEAMTELMDLADPGARRNAIRRLAEIASVIRYDPQKWQGEAWRRAGGIGPATRAWMDLLMGGEGMVASTSVLRVTARLTGSDVDRQNRLSHGRMQLARLVGDGEPATMINVALHRLGVTLCTADQPACLACPVRQLCPSSGSSGGDSRPVRKRH